MMMKACRLCRMCFMRLICWFFIPFEIRKCASFLVNSVVGLASVCLLCYVSQYIYVFYVQGLTVVIVSPPKKTSGKD